MIPIKSQDEIRIMTECGQILQEALELLKSNIKPGVKTIELDDIFNRFCFKKKVKPAFKGYKSDSKSYPYSICVSVNEEVVHGLPGERVIREGDIVTVDAGILKDGFITDSAFTVGVGKISSEANKLLTVTEESLEEAIKVVKEGANVGDISFEIYDYVKKNNIEVYKSLAGHGVGRKLHEEPSIQNFGHRGKGEKLEEGMTLAIEVMATLGKGELELASDGWTLKSSDNALSAQFEHTVLVQKNGFKILV